ncbi:HAMP domain-containing sensor histidine kinase [Natrinema sp. 1APR25-10V2]|uniref:HAMP domain-containing sensor histidine kinase n=1 Tax=Natrinema sp. 1APR25-10V2 TaxID=2951081 RepID=UPI0028771AD2|nr:HAMP domain-containing sensor histidine kinase [Natrinema sp. 1APR25-10V2]MDS0475902.1 HAMP domain-containing histidine kinase [Natrinema sp. 1APR25-10V2]
MSHDTPDWLGLRPSAPWLRQESVPWIVSGFGGLSFAFLVGWWIVFADLLDATAVLLSLALVGGPALGLVWGGYHLERSDIDPSRYGRVLEWFFGGALGFLLINLLTMAVFPWSFAGNVSWAQFAANAGAVGGFAVGYVEARAIQREVEATAATVRAEQLADERELLTYLNDLLRHEVLNSSQIISGHATLLREECDDERTRERLATIERESDDLVGVIEDVRAMLDANRGPEGGAVVDLTALLEEQLADCRARYDDATVEAELPEAVAVRGNKGLRWVFSNLLENAIEHNDGDTARVRVTVDAAPETVTVTVADDGPGIPEATRETLFERKSNNHGLGLYLSRILANRYGGTVELAETGADGSAFVVTLPRAGGDGDTAA